jgi:hypothetical protein
MQDPVNARLFDRRLSMVAAIAFPLIVLAGFARTYYLRGYFAGPPLPSRMVHAHGLLMTAWVALFVTQVGLISSRRVRLHQRLGYAGVALGVLIVAVGLVAALRAAKYGSASTPPGIPPMDFMVVPFFDLVMFVILFGAAVYFRKRPAIHKRLMLLTVINFIPPAIGRIPIPALVALGPIWFFGLPTVLALFCVWLDARHNERVNGIFLTGALLLIASYVVRLALAGTDGWRRVALWLTSYV